MIEVIIDNKAKVHLNKLYKYIRKDSYQNAEMVPNRIVESIMSLSTKWEQHPPDKYRKIKDVNYRAYEILKYRITYHFIDNKILVTRIRHTKMTPLHY
jgi:plasmid stabilization system protein ParE